MSESDSIDLREHLKELGRSLGEREAAHGAGVQAARKQAERLREAVADGIEAFHQAASEAGASHLRIDLSPLRTDDKHLRSVEFDLARGRYRAIVTVKSRGDITLVGPFRQGKVEGPCKSFPFDAGEELQQALAGFIQEFLEEAATP